MIWKEYNDYIISEDGRISSKKPTYDKVGNIKGYHFCMIRNPKDFFSINGKRYRKEPLMKKLFKKDRNE